MTLIWVKILNYECQATSDNVLKLDRYEPCQAALISECYEKVNVVNSFYHDEYLIAQSPPVTPLLPLSTCRPSHFESIEITVFEDSGAI